jgi:hypothetical protein
MSLIDRISAFSYDGRGGETLSQNDNENEDVLVNDLKPDSTSLITMLENIIRRCLDPRANEIKTDILIESERWVPNLGQEQKQEWSTRHLSALDWRTFEATPVVKAPTLAEVHTYTIRVVV